MASTRVLQRQGQQQGQQWGPQHPWRSPQQWHPPQQWGPHGLGIICPDGWRGSRGGRNVGSCQYRILPSPLTSAAVTIADASLSFTLDHNYSTVTPLAAPIPVALADPTSGPADARSSTTLPCPAIPSSVLTGLYISSFSWNLVGVGYLQDHGVTVTFPAHGRTAICTSASARAVLAMFTREHHSCLFILHTLPPQVAASCQVTAPDQVVTSCQVTVDSKGVGAGGACLGGARAGGAGAGGAEAGGAGAGGTGSGGAGTGGSSSEETAAGGTTTSAPTTPPHRYDTPRAAGAAATAAAAEAVASSAAAPATTSATATTATTSAATFAAASPTAYGPTFPPPDSAPAVFSPPQSQSPPPVVPHDWTTRCHPLARPSSHIDDLRTVLFHSSPCRSPTVSVLPPPPESPLTISSNPITDYNSDACPVVTHVLSSLVTNPCASPSSVSVLTSAVTDFAATRRLDYATRVVVSPPTCPLSARGEFALRCDVLEDRQFELEFLAAASPSLYAMMLSPEGDPDALVIPTLARTVLQQFGFQFFTTQPTPLAVYHRITGPFPDEPIESSGPYPKLVGCVMYLMSCTHPDLAFPLSVRSRFVVTRRHRPVHWTPAVRVAKYLETTSGMGLVLGRTQPAVLTGHCNSSYADDLET
ncbi:unnamed protein product [Closterium sp. NIES-54]